MKYPKLTTADCQDLRVLLAHSGFNRLYMYVTGETAEFRIEQHHAGYCRVIAYHTTLSAAVEAFNDQGGIG